MTNTSLILWEFLTTSGTSLYTLVGKRIRTDLTKDDGGTFWKNSTAAILYTISGETVPNAAQDVTSTVTFRCYSGSDVMSGARAVYSALHDRLRVANNAVTTTGRILNAELVTASQGGFDPDTGWAVYLVTYRITFD